MQQNEPAPDLPIVTIIATAKTIAGDDLELLRLLIAAELERSKQERLITFQGRTEFSRQVIENNIFYQHSMREYGLQVLKWLFLLNAGAIAVTLTYVGAGLSKAATPSDVQHIATLAKSLWPFALGCILVTVAGAAAYFNFTYASHIHPNASDLYNFSVTDTPIWPKPRGTRQNETPADIFKRIGRRMSWSRYLAITLAGLAGGSFAWGVINVFSHV